MSNQSASVFGHKKASQLLACKESKADYFGIVSKISVLGQPSMGRADTMVCKMEDVKSARIMA